MNNKKLIVKGLRPMIHPENFANTIYANFIYLANSPDLMHTKQEIQRLLTDENMIGYIISDNNHIIAYLIGEIKHLNDGRIVFYISYIFVAPKYRSQKLGTYLLKKVIQRSQEKGIKFIILTCDSKLLSYYDKFGFQYDPVLRSNDDKQHILTLYL
jgi:ribosomal protein S18 acetylase RimI-like enzyme